MSSFKLSNKELIELQKIFRNGEIKENEIPKTTFRPVKRIVS